jgi:hypothetical protein
MFIKTLYPNTKIHVRRKKVGIMANDKQIEVVDFSDVDPSLLEESKMIQIQQWQLYLHLMIIQINQTLRFNSTDTNERSTRWRFGSSSDESKSAVEEQLDSLEKRLKKDVIYSKLGS